MSSSFSTIPIQTTVYNYANTLSVANALTVVTEDPAFRDFITKNNSVWVAFGSRNSHTLRTKLFQLYQQDKVSKMDIFKIHFFFSVIPDPGRIIEGISMFEPAVQNDLKPVVAFIEKRVVKLVKMVKQNTFCGHWIPNCMPGLDLYCAALSMSVPMDQDEMDTSVNSIIARKTFMQMNVTQDLLDENKEAQRHYWDNVVGYSDLTDRMVKTKAGNIKGNEHSFQESYWETQSRDSYNLLLRDKQGNLVEWVKKGKYNRANIEKWFRSVKEIPEVTQQTLPTTTVTSDAAKLLAEANMLKDKLDKLATEPDSAIKTANINMYTARRNQIEEEMKAMVKASP